MPSCIALTVGAGKNDATSLPFTQELKQRLDDKAFYPPTLAATGLVGFLANQLGTVKIMSLLIAHLANTQGHTHPGEGQTPLLDEETGFGTSASVYTPLRQ